MKTAATYMRVPAATGYVDMGDDGTGLTPRKVEGIYEHLLENAEEKE